MLILNTEIGKVMELHIFPNLTITGENLESILSYLKLGVVPLALIGKCPHYELKKIKKNSKHYFPDRVVDRVDPNGIEYVSLYVFGVQVAYWRYCTEKQANELIKDSCI